MKDTGAIKPSKLSTSVFWPKIRVIKYPESLYIVQTRKWFKWHDFNAFHDIDNAVECADGLFKSYKPIKSAKKKVLYKL